MNINKELNWDELNHSYKPSDFSFKTTDEVEIMDDLLGQEEALEAIRRGLKIKSKGYNLYICNDNGHKIDEIIKKEVLKVASKQVMPLATGYVYNFHHPEEPRLIQLKVKDATSLQEDLEELQAFIRNDLPVLLSSEEVQQKQEQIIEAFERVKEKYLLQIEEKAEEYHILPKRTQEGIQFAPLDEQGKVISKEDFLLLSLEKQNEIVAKILEVQEYADTIIEKVMKQETTYLELYDEVAQEVFLREIGLIMKKLIDRYHDYVELKRYFNDLAEDLLNHIDLILQSSNEQTEPEGDMSVVLAEQNREKVFRNYRFNLMVIPENEGVPIINDYDYPEVNLNGKWLMNIEENMLSSDYLHIRPGLFHYANGGYLILHMEELLAKNNGWMTLKRMLRMESISIEGNEELGLALAHTLKPQPMKANLKVILIGSHSIYEALSNYDESFKEFFKVKINLKDEVICDKVQIEKLAGIIKNASQKEKLLPVSTSALLKLVELGHRKTDHPTRIPASIEQMIDIIREAQWYAQNQIEAEDIEACLAGRESYERALQERLDEPIKEEQMIDIIREAQWYAQNQIEAEDIEACLAGRESYERALQERLDEPIKEDTYLIDTKGIKVGQVNGLAIYHVGTLTFGRPVRITATTYRGKQGIVDIENEAKLSGAIHTKGVHIISGFLGSQFAQEYPISLSCNLCFEQSYVKVDGDSASSAELYAILSSLSEVPIMQNLAVTGSVNQFGEIQPIGGVNEKIEGFYKICKQRGLEGNEGVIIPRQNTKELILAPEIIEDVKKHQFHIYAISHIWQGVEIIMNECKEQVILKVKEKLKKYSV